MSTRRATKAVYDAGWFHLEPDFFDGSPSNPATIQVTDRDDAEVRIHYLSNGEWKTFSSNRRIGFIA